MLVSNKKLESPKIKKKMCIKTEISIKMYEKFEIALKFTKQIPLKMLVGFKKNCNRHKFTLKSPSILQEKSLENVGRFQNTFNFRREINTKNFGRFQKLKRNQ